eukprot:CAMPEP_0117570042 /NCGR_PEP_ID=MMETSP0784-20121206/58983_1 /TAXON_ID=39447 /ORGANISM="" /LENGTH=278 /DNA_ID=CAMNT_0005368061 /DNA_START=30 /DNA_END=866 /DNA_ORIENTATION=+
MPPDPVGTRSGDKSNLGSMAAAPQPEVVIVMLPDGTEETRLVWVDFAAGHIVLQQVDLDDEGETLTGGQAALKLASIADGASAEGEALVLRAGGREGRKLLELRFGSRALAQAWADCLVDHRGSQQDQQSRQTQQSQQKRPDFPDGTAASASAALLKLVEQQEEQVRLLEAINGRKEENFVLLQEQLEETLARLQASQAIYMQQQDLLDSQQQLVEKLSAMLRAADAAEAACVANAAEAAAGAVACLKVRRASADAGAERAPIAADHFPVAMGVEASE